MDRRVEVVKEKRLRCHFDLVAGRVGHRMLRFSDQTSLTEIDLWNESNQNWLVQMVASRTSVRRTADARGNASLPLTIEIHLTRIV